MNHYINLLPAHVRQRQAFTARLGLWAFVWFFGLAAALVPVGIAYSRSAAAAAQRAQLEETCQRWCDLEREIKPMQEQLTGLQHREHAALSLAEQRPLLTLLGLVSQAARSCDGGLYVTRLSLQRSAATGGTPAENSGSAAGNSRGAASNVVILNGVSASHLQIAGFAASLREGGLFSSVDVKSSLEKAIEDRQTLEFLIECMY